MAYQPVPYIFNTRTSPIPLSELDEDLRYISDKIFYIRDFYYSGATDDQAFDLAAAQLLIEGGTLVLEANVTYQLFAGATARVIFSAQGTTRPFKIQGNGATIQSVNVASPSTCYFINGNTSQGIYVENLIFIGTANTGGLPLVSTTGERFVSFNGAARNIFISNCYVKNCQSGVQCVVEGPVNENVTVLNTIFERVYYPLSLWCTRNVLANIRTKECGRSYFPVSIGGYNCENHDVTIHSESGYTDADCLFHLSCRTGIVSQMNNMKVNYFSNGRAPGAGAASSAMMYFDLRQEVGQNGAAWLQNVHVNFYINGLNSAGAAADNPNNIVQLVKRVSTGAGDNTPRSHVVNNVTIGGVAVNWTNSALNGICLCDTAAIGGTSPDWTGDFVTGLALRDVVIAGVPAGVNTIIVSGQGAIAGLPFLTTQNVYVEGGISYLNVTAAQISEDQTKSSTFNATNVNSRAYTPVVTASGGGWVNGNSVLTGRYSKRGRDVHYEGSIVIDTGGGFNPGVGTYTISAPLGCVGATWGIGQGLMLDAGTTYYRCIVVLPAGSSQMTVYFGDVAGQWQVGTPFVLATGDNFQWSIDYMSEA